MMRAVCPWNGLARRIKGRVTFWNGVRIESEPEGRLPAWAGGRR